MKGLKEFILNIKRARNIRESSSHMTVKSLWGDL